MVTAILVYLAVEGASHNTYDNLEPDYMLYTAIAGVVFNVM